ncbi:hypothetical protein [Actinoplanes sp. NPDC051494]|uniref:hypothetical protein n=1 Tax=Actinoplanes sp. NPDC051494 TaxID=3363907 RepID=UPI0037B394CB
MTRTGRTLWTAVICDENRKRAFFAYDDAAGYATFADSCFVVSIIRDSALPRSVDGRLIPESGWAAVDEVHTVESPLIDDTSDELGLAVVFRRAQIMAAALNVAETGDVS